MTYDLYAPRNHNHSSVANANGVSYPVKGAGRVELTLSLYWKLTLVVTALSNNILYVPQVIKQLNCLLLIYHYFLSSLGRIMSVKGSARDKENHIWL